MNACRIFCLIVVLFASTVEAQISTSYPFDLSQEGDVVAKLDKKSKEPNFIDVK